MTLLEVGTGTAPRSMAGGSRGLIGWVCTSNPFYVLSALLVCLGLWVSFGSQAVAAQTWALLLGHGRLHAAPGGDGVPAGPVRRRLGRRPDGVAAGRADVPGDVGDLRRGAGSQPGPGRRLLSRGVRLRRRRERGDAAGNPPGVAAALSGAVLPDPRAVLPLPGGDHAAAGPAAERGAALGALRILACRRSWRSSRCCPPSVAAASMSAATAAHGGGRGIPGRSSACSPSGSRRGRHSSAGRCTTSPRARPSPTSSGRTSSCPSAWPSA